MNMSAFVLDENLDTIAINTNIPSGDYSFENNIFNWTVSGDLRRGNQTVYVRFTANDTLGASSEYWPDIYYCGCQNMTECDFTLSVEAETDNFYTARCNCAEGKDGDLCEMDKDYCTPNPCYQNVSCSNKQGGFRCGFCPTGMQGDGSRCYDVNECYLHPILCNQTCESVVGSFKCGCVDVYRLGDDNSSCHDIDECVDRNNNKCSATEQCINVPGSFKCECSQGYINSANGCRKVLASYVGNLVFATPERHTDDNDIVDRIKTSMNHAFWNIVDGIIFSVDVRDLKPLTTRFIQTTGSLSTYSITFILQSDTALDTSSVIIAFNRKIKALSGSTENYDILLFIDSDKSKVYTDDDAYSICNITEMVECDLITTDCNTVNGVQSCPCKNGFKEFSSTTCRDIDECVDRNNNNCFATEQCINFIGSFKCECSPGYINSANGCRKGNGSRSTEQSNNEEQDAKTFHISLVTIVGSIMGSLAVVLTALILFIIYHRRQKVKAKKTDACVGTTESGSGFSIPVNTGTDHSYNTLDNRVMDNSYSVLERRGADNIYNTLESSSRTEHTYNIMLDSSSTNHTYNVPGSRTTDHTYKMIECRATVHTNNMQGNGGTAPISNIYKMY